jgi:hypothetical protein
MHELVRRAPHFLNFHHYRNEFRDLLKQWEGWDIFTSLVNYRSVLGVLFSFLHDMVGAHSLLHHVSS